MSTNLNLRGGLESNSSNGHANGEKPAKKKPDFQEATQKARREIAARRELNMETLSEEPIVREADGSMSAKEIASKVDDFADRVYDWILNTVRPFLRQLVIDIKEVGEEVLDDRSAIEGQTNRQRKEDYEGVLASLQLYAPENTKELREEAQRPGREEFVRKMCRRVIYATQIALLVDDISQAETKDDLEKLILTATETVENGAKPVFAKAKTNDRNKVWCFGKQYVLTDGVFGVYKDFAREELFEAIQARSRDLAMEHAKVVKLQEQEVSAGGRQLDAAWQPGLLRS